MNTYFSNVRLRYLFLVISLFVIILLFGRSFGVLFITANIILILSLKMLAHKRKKSRKLKRLFQIVLTSYCIFIISFVLVEIIIIYHGHTSKEMTTSDIDVVVILGAGLNGEIPSKTLEDRLNTGLRVLQRDESLPVIVSGGQGPGETITEAEAMGRFLVEHGIEANRIKYERQSTSTNENIQFSKDLMTELEMENPTVLIVTSDYHMLRAKIICKQVDLTCKGASGNSPFFIKMNYVIREYFGLIKTWIF